MPTDIVIDCEVHLLHPKARSRNFGNGGNEPVRRAIHEHKDFQKIEHLLSLEALLESMDRNGICRSIIMGMPWRAPGILHDNNAYVADCAAAHKDRFRALYIPDPLDPRKAAKKVESLDDSLFLGAKLVPSWQGVAIDDPALSPLWRALEGRDMFLMVHTDHPTQSLTGDAPYRLLQFLRMNPKLKVLAPHLGGLLCLYALMPDLREAMAKVHFVTSVSATMEMVGFAARINSKNLIFGTDFPFNHCHSQGEPLAAIKALGLSHSATSEILGLTAADLFSFGPLGEKRT